MKLGSVSDTNVMGVHAVVAQNSKGVMAVKSARELSINHLRRMPLLGPLPISNHS